MKTVIRVELESPDRYDEITPEEGESIEDYKNHKGLLIGFQEGLAKTVHKEVVGMIKSYLLDKRFLEEDWLDNRYETWIDGYDSFDDYKIKISYSERL